MINKRLDIIEEQIKEIKEFIKDDDYFKMLENGLNRTNKENDKLRKKIIKYIKVLDKIEEYVKNDYDKNKEVIEYCNFDYFYKHILELLEATDD